MAKPFHPERPPQLPDSAEYLRLSPDGHPLWLNPEFGQYGLVFVDLPSGEVRSATAAELQIVSDDQLVRPTIKKEATVPARRKSPPAKSRSGGKPSTAKSSGGNASGAKTATAKGPKWKELEGQERGRYLLEHQTISDKLHTTKDRHKGEGREAFIRRIYGLEGAS